DSARWQIDTVQTTAARAFLDNALRAQEARPQPVLSGSFPIAVGGSAVFRGADGIHAVSVVSGKKLWHVQPEKSLDRLLGDAETRPHVEAWINTYAKIHPNILLENTTIGCLSSDGRRVYFVDDLPVIPYTGKASTTALGRPK